MRFKATDEQLATVMANAVNASRPLGMGFLHFDESKTYTPEDFMDELKTNTGWVSLDYVGGRMVKFRLIPEKDGYYEIADSAVPQSDYQSWCHTYPTYKELISSAGIEVEDE